MTRQADMGKTSNRHGIQKSVVALLLAILLISVYSYSPPTRPIDPKNDVQTALLLSDHDFTQDEILLLDSLGRISSVSGPVAVIQADPIALLKIQHFSFVKREEP